jgi:hypothetical protein
MSFPHEFSKVIAARGGCVLEASKPNKRNK